jgi:hypothetical protein
MLSYIIITMFLLVVAGAIRASSCKDFYINADKIIACLGGVWNIKSVCSINDSLLVQVYFFDIVTVSTLKKIFRDKILIERNTHKIKILSFKQVDDCCKEGIKILLNVEKGVYYGKRSS